jgi:hypothetical protein
MRAYSHDLGIRVLRAIHKGMPKPEAGCIFGVSPHTIERCRQLVTW